MCEATGMAMREKGIETCDGTRGARSCDAHAKIAPMTIKQTLLSSKSKNTEQRRSSGLTPCTR